MKKIQNMYGRHDLDSLHLFIQQMIQVNLGSLMHIHS